MHQFLIGDLVSSECKISETIEMTYDVVIVGAGPAGATAAKNLAEQGRSVLLLDKRKFPADKPCGGGLPTRVQRRFPYIHDYIDSISYASKTFSMSMQHSVDISRDTPLLATVLRKHFDHELVKLAQKKGAKASASRST